MIIDLARLKAEVDEFAGEEPKSVLELEAEKDMRVESPIRYDLRVSLVSGKLLVNGKIGVDMSFQCSRCAEFFREEVVEPDFEAVYDAREKSGVLDLTPEMREAILLRFPNYPVCRSDCKGLCARCGANLNKGACRCGSKAFNDRWGALDRLTLK